MKKEDVEDYFHFLGYGDIKKAKIWFIGIEPGENKKQRSEFNQQSKHEINVEGERLTHDLEFPSKGNTRVWSCSRDLAGSEPYFIGNMAPLPRHTEQIPHSLMADPRQYIEKVCREYIPRLHKAYEHHAPAVLIFHGKGAFKTYQVATEFSLKDEERHTEGGISFYDRHKIIVCGNFSRGRNFNNHQKARVIQKIKTWLTR